MPRRRDALPGATQQVGQPARAGLSNAVRGEEKRSPLHTTNLVYGDTFAFNVPTIKQLPAGIYDKLIQVSSEGQQRTLLPGSNGFAGYSRRFRDFGKGELWFSVKAEAQQDDVALVVWQAFDSRCQIGHFKLFKNTFFDVYLGVGQGFAVCSLFVWHQLIKAVHTRADDLDVSLIHAGSKRYLMFGWLSLKLLRQDGPGQRRPVPLFGRMIRRF